MDAMVRSGVVIKFNGFLKVFPEKMQVVGTWILSMNLPRILATFYLNKLLFIKNYTKKGFFNEEVIVFCISCIYMFGQ